MTRHLITTATLLLSTLSLADEYQPDIDNGAFLHAEHCS